MSLRSSILPSARSAIRFSSRNATPKSQVNLPRANQVRLNSSQAGNQAKGSGPIPASGAASTRGSTSSNLLLISVGTLALGGGLFLYSSEDAKKNLLGLVGGDSSASKVKEGHARPIEDYQKVYNDIADALETHNPEYDVLGTYGPVLVRLAWHASGTYDKESNAGGSNGATMRFAPESNHGANAGLHEARDFMEVIHKKHPWITYSDLWTLGGVAAVQEMGGPKIQWRPGRKDGLEEHCTPDGRLPDGDKGSDHLRSIFYRMGFNDQEIVALSGAHALGRCHSDRSGFDGPWTHSPNSMTNEYYNLLLNEKWQYKKWKGPIQFEDKSTKSLMMLTTDMALTTDKGFRPHVERYAKSEEEFFKDFSAVYAKLLELGVPKDNWKPWEVAGGKKYEFLTTAEQEKK